MKMHFWAFNTATAESRTFHFIWQAGTVSKAFQTVLAVQELRFFFYKKLYRKQPVEFLITEHIFLTNHT